MDGEYYGAGDMDGDGDCMSEEMDSEDDRIQSAEEDMDGPSGDEDEVRPVPRGSPPFGFALASPNHVHVFWT